jgi:hypothetical protein
MSPYALVVWIHLLAGGLALLGFWSAALARKGSASHRLAGRSFLLAMLAVIATAIPMAANQFLQGRPIGGLFLSYLVILVATGCWAAWFAIRWRREPARFYGRTNAALSALNLLSGAVVSITGWVVGSMLLGGFGLVGVLAGIGGLRALRRSERPANWWLREHYGAMLGNGVATHIAFLGIGLRRLLPELDFGSLQLLAWFGPLLVAVLAGLWLERRYGRPVRATV